MLPDPESAAAARHPQRKANVAISADALLRAARGFSCVFWGIPVGLLLYSGTLDLRLSPFLRLPTYVGGVFVIYCGMILFQRAGPLSPLWPRRVREALFILLLQVYLAPFLYWWRQMPHVPYYVANVVGLVFCTAMGLLVLNMLAADLAGTLHDPVLRAEARAAAWLAVAFMVVPAADAVIHSIRTVFQADNMTFMETFPIPPEMPRWLRAAAFVPFGLTMAITWKAKELALRTLRVSAKLPPAPAGA